MVFFTKRIFDTVKCIKKSGLVKLKILLFGKDGQVSGIYEIIDKL